MATATPWGGQPLATTRLPSLVHGGRRASPGEGRGSALTRSRSPTPSHSRAHVLTASAPGRASPGPQAWEPHASCRSGSRPPGFSASTLSSLGVQQPPERLLPLAPARRSSTGLGDRPEGQSPGPKQVLGLGGLAPCKGGVWAGRPWMPPTGQRRPQRQEVRGRAGRFRLSIREASACRPKWAAGPSRRAGRPWGGRGAASNRTRPRPEFLRRVLGSLGQSRLRPRPSLRPAGARGGRRSGHCPPSGCISVPARGGRRAGARDAWVPGLGGLGGVPLLRVPGRDREPPTGAREPLAGPGPVPGRRGKDDPAALGPSARGRCRSLDGPLRAQVQGQLGRREEPRAGPGRSPAAGVWGWGRLLSLPLRAVEAGGFTVQREVRPRGAAEGPGALATEAPGS